MLERKQKNFRNEKESFSVKFLNKKRRIPEKKSIFLSNNIPEIVTRSLVTNINRYKSSAGSNSRKQQNDVGKILEQHENLNRNSQDSL